MFDDSTVFEQHHVHVPIFSRQVSVRKKTDYRPEVYFDGAAMLEQLVQGNPSLFVMTDSFDVEHFFYRMGSDTTLQLVTYEPFESDKEFGQYAYRNELERLGLAAGCGETVRDDLQKIEYEAVDMLHFFRQLNACNGQVAQVSGRFNKRGLMRAGILGGGRYTSEQFDMPYNLKRRSSALGFLLGIWADFFPRRQNTNRMISLDLAMNLGNARLNGGNKVLQLPDVDFSYTSVYFDAVGRWLFNPKKKIRPFLEGGIGVDYLISGYVHSRYLSPSGAVETSSYNYGDPYAEVLLGAGIYGRLGSLSVRYGQPFSAINSLHNHNVSLVLRVGLLR